MPSHLVHAYLDRLYFGRAYWKVHRLIDSAYPFFGGQHRFFWHDEQSAFVIAMYCYPNDENAIYSALLHIQIDMICSANPLLRRQLELLAEVDAKKRRKGRKKKKEDPLPLGLENFLKDLEKMVRIRKMMELS